MPRIRVTARVEGLGDFRRAVKGMQRRVAYAGRGIASESLAVIERAAKGNFEGTHPPGFPHVGGNKPNIVTGMLRRSVRATPVRADGLAAWVGDVGPTTVYGRRIELGYPGGSGPGHQRTRPFPYLKPAAKASHGPIRNVAYRRWAKAIAK